MEIIYSLESIKKKITPLSVLSIGFFDGMHIGHKKIINLMHKSFKDRKKVIITFDRKLKKKEIKKSPLFNMEQRLLAFKENKIDAVILLELNEKLTRLSYKDFLMQVKHKISFDHLILGKNACFGHRQKGTEENIKAIEKQYGFSSIYLEEELIEEKIVSTTSIKEAIINGNISLANQMLGFSYEVDVRLLNQETDRFFFKLINNIIPKKGSYLFEIKEEPYYCIGTIKNGLLIINKNNSSFVKDKPIKIKLLKKIEV